jgi:hypothetical protein
VLAANLPGTFRQRSVSVEFSVSAIAKSAKSAWIQNPSGTTGRATAILQPAIHGLWTYNNERPNMGLGGITPAQKLNRRMATQTAA